MNPNPSVPNVDQELEEVIGKTLGMYLIREGDSREWIDTVDWHISDGDDSCSGTDDKAQLEGYKNLIVALKSLITQARQQAIQECIEAGPKDFVEDNVVKGWNQINGLWRTALTKLSDEVPMSSTTPKDKELNHE